MSIDFARGIDKFVRPSNRPTVATIGTFDGIHRGHQEILKRVLIASEKTGYDPVLVTFHPHPRVLVTPDDVPLLLTTMEEKERFLPDFFRGTVLVLDFNDKLKEASAEWFVRDILVGKLGMKKLVVGYDHAFGKNRSGNIAELTRLGKELDFETEVVGPVTAANQRVSSSVIRRTLRNGRLAEALELLGHPYAIFGTVEKGIGLGRKIGYPTANVKYNPRKLLPSEGVYSCRAQIGKLRKDGMMFVGRNHFNPQGRITVEANLFDFHDEIYDKEITVCPTRFIRENRKFDSTGALTEQIRSDKKDVLRIIEKEKQECQ